MFYDGFDSSSYLEHYGVKGMKWGIRRDRSKRDLQRLDKAAKKYYSRVNSYNQKIDEQKRVGNRERRSIQRSSNSVRKKVNKFMKRYGNATVEPKISADGYTIQYVKSTIVHLDNLNRVSKVDFMMSPLENKKGGKTK